MAELRADAPGPLAEPLGRSLPDPRPAPWSARLAGWLRSRWALGSVLLLLALASVNLGAVPVTAADWAAPPWLDTPRSGGAYVLWALRLPRVLLALLVGATLGLCGLLSQALFRNPMADPGLLGVSSGAAAAVALSLTVFSGLAWSLPPVWRLWVTPVMAFGGALLVSGAIERLASWLAPGSISALLLCGLALQALSFALVGLCTFIASDEQLRSLTFWTLGSLTGANWWMVGCLLLALGGLGRLAWRLRDALNALALGEAVAGHIGLSVARLRLQLVLIIALLSAVAVAWCGSIGFIGLMAPHLARHLVGPDMRRALPMAMLQGAGLLLLADTLARTVAMPAEVPVGIFTALIGAPWLLALLRDTLRRQGSAG